MANLAWVAFGFVGSILLGAKAVGVTTLFDYADDETEAWAGPIFGFGGYLVSIAILPVVCLIIHRNRPERRGKATAATLLGAVIPFVLAVLFLFVATIIGNAVTS